MNTGLFLWSFFWISLFMIISPFIIFPTLLFVGKMILKPADLTFPSFFKDLPFVSLLICAYNEEETIEEKIRNSLSLDYPYDRFEIIIASDGSTDATNRISRHYSNQYSHIRFLDWSKREGKINVINKSISECAGEIIILSDANALCNKNCIKLIVRHFFDKRVGAVDGEKRVIAVEDQPIEDLIGHAERLHWRLESSIKRLESLWGKVIGADGAIYAIRKDAFSPVSSDTPVDDFLITMQILKDGWHVRYEPEAYVVELASTSLINEFRRKTRIASGQYYNLMILKSMLNIIKYRWISVFYIMHKLSRLFSPFFFIYSIIFFFIHENTIWIAYLLGASCFIAVMGLFMEQSFIYKQKLIHMITYYWLTVIAQFLGLLKIATGQQSAMWEKQR